jgi:hypothetical protein
VGEGTSAPQPEVVAAREALLASRASLDEELVRLEASARAAVDIRAKVRRSPAKAAGIAAGAGFLVVGGPRRLFRRARNAMFGTPDPLPKSMLPKKIDQALGKLGSDGAKVRGTIEREFAAYLEEKAPERKRRDLSGTLSTLLMAAGLPLVTRYGKQIVDKLTTADPQQLLEQLEKVRARRAASGIDEAS